MKTLQMFDAPIHRTEKPTTITIRAGAGRYISARSLFTHLRDVLEQCDFHGSTTLIVLGDGSVMLDDETVYRPRRTSKLAQNFDW